VIQTNPLSSTSPLTFSGLRPRLRGTAPTGLASVRTSRCNYPVISPLLHLPIVSRRARLGRPALPYLFKTPRPPRLTKSSFYFFVSLACSSVTPPFPSPLAFQGPRWKFYLLLLIGAIRTTGPRSKLVGRHPKRTPPPWKATTCTGRRSQLRVSAEGPSCV
jgi:hypothetical protein